MFFLFFNFSSTKNIQKIVCGPMFIVFKMFLMVVFDFFGIFFKTHEKNIPKTRSLLLIISIVR